MRLAAVVGAVSFLVAASFASAGPVPDTQQEAELKFHFISLGVQAADDELLGSQAVAHPTEQAGLAKARLLLIGLIAKLRAQAAREIEATRQAEQARAKAKAEAKKEEAGKTQGQ
jgi:hypothetical protein